ncbi:MAG: zinc-ribbon domain-containing protein [Promethearchaeota archaeon]
MAQDLKKTGLFIIGLLLFFMIFTNNIILLKTQPNGIPLTIQNKFAIKESSNMKCTELSAQAFNLGLVSTEWNIANNVTITPPDFTLLIIIGSIIIGGVAIGYSSYVVFKKRESRKRDKLQTFIEQYNDVMNLKYIIVLHSKTGIDLHSQSFEEKELDPTLISGFLQAVRAFGSEISADRESKTIQIPYKDSIIIMTEFVNIRLILIMKKSPSKDFIHGVELLVYDIYKYYGKLIEEFHGNIRDFRGIKELIEKHLNVSFIYPPKVEVPNNVRLNPAEKEMVEKAKKIMDEFDKDDRDDDLLGSLYGYKPPPPPDDRDDRFPYPYVYKPPEPPDDIKPAPQAQRVIIKEKEPKKELICQYCGYKLSKGHKFCPVCGKDIF